MWRCFSGVFITVGLALLYGLQTGLCVTLQSVDPESGSVIRRVEGAQNISLFCEAFNEGSPVQTRWLQQTADDIEAGRGPSFIPNDDENFIRSGDSIVESGITVQLNTNLTILTLTAELDKVIISCATATDISSLANFTLRVYQPPRLSDIGEMTLRENEELSVDLSEPGSPPALPFPSDVTWTRGGEQLMNSTDTRLYGYPSIFIGSVLPSDAGLYTLTATNHQQDGLTPIGTDSGSFSLNVLFGAGLSGEDVRTVAVVEGDPVTLVCGTDLTGNPLPLIVWRDNNAIEVPSGGRFTVSSGRAVVSLSLNSTDREDAGNWTCTAQVYENITTGLTVGTPVERTIQLLVVVAPSAPEDLTLEGMPGPSWVSFSWFQTSSGIPPLSRYVVLVVGGGEERNVTVEGSRTSTTVTGLLPGTDYMIRMVAVSEYGDVQAFSSPSTAFTATTTVSAPLPVCSEPPQVVDDRLVVTWTYTHTGGLPISSVDVLFNLDTAPDNRMPFSSVPGAMEGSGSDVTEASIPLPEAGLHYQFTVRANNSEGPTEVACPALRLDTGIPSRPDPPTVTSDKGAVIVMATTAHSGVRDSNVDNFHFILQISNVDDDSKSPIERLQSVACEAGGQQCSASITLSVDEELSEGVKYIVNVMAVNRFGESEVSGNSEVFNIGEDSGNGGDGNRDASSSSSSTGVIVGGVIGALVIVALFILIIILGLFILFKLRSKLGGKYSMEKGGGGGGGGGGVRVEEVDGIDLGQDLDSSRIDPDKELQYADLEHFQKPKNLPPGNASYTKNNNNTVDDEPVQYATIQELNAKRKKPSTSSAGEEGEEMKNQEEGGEGEGEDKGESKGEGDKALTSSTFV